MQTAEPVYKMEATDRMVKILDSTCVKANLEHVTDNVTHLKSEERTQLLGLLKDLEDLLDETLGDWETDPIKLALNPYSKLFSCIYYTVPRTNKDTFCKELQRLVKIGVLTLAQHSH